MADDYRIMRQVHINSLDRASGQVVPGWEISVRDLVTGTVVPVFVSDDLYSPDNARQIIEASLEQIRSVHSLGQ